MNEHISVFYLTPACANPTCWRRVEHTNRFFPFGEKVRRGGFNLSHSLYI